MSKWTFDRWWRVVAKKTPMQGVFSSGLWCETSDEEEAREAMTRCPYPCRLERHQVRSEQRWIEVYYHADE